MHHYLTTNTGGLSEYHPFFRTRNGMLGIPVKYKELFLEFETANLPYTPASIEYARQVYIQSFYLNYWYSDDPFVTKITASSKLFDYFNLPSELEMGEHMKDGVFIRLNSVSPKITIPIFNLQSALDCIHNSSRCQSAIWTAKKYDFPVMLVLRKFQNMDQGCEYRAFVYNNDRLTAIPY